VRPGASKLNLMVQSEAESLDVLFAALSDATRRSVLDRLGEGGSLTVTELAEPHGMSLTGFMKHLRVLEDAGLVTRTKEGRVVRCELSPVPMQEAAAWLMRYERFWTGRLDALARFLYHQEETGWRAQPVKKAARRAPSVREAGVPAARPGGPAPKRKR